MNKSKESCSLLLLLWPDQRKIGLLCVGLEQVTDNQ